MLCVIWYFMIILTYFFLKIKMCLCSHDHIYVHCIYNGYLFFIFFKNITLKYQLFTKVVLNFEKALYCKSENFRENFIVAICVKIHICDDENSRSGYDLPRSVKDMIIPPFREDFIYTKLRICKVSRK